MNAYPLEKRKKDGMMEIRVPYGTGFQVVNLDPARVAGIIHPNEVAAQDVEAVLRTALNHPVGSGDFSTFLGSAGPVLVVVNDGTRPTPTARVLNVLKGMMDFDRCRFIVATGCHRAPLEEEYRLIFGADYDALAAAGKIEVHDARDDTAMVDLGVSKNGTRMWINRAVVDAERILVIGSVEPHYFAGYTGGRKAFLPGLASYETITMNHRHALNRAAQSLALTGNPVHEDMVDALAVLQGKAIFSIQTVLDRNRRIYAAAAGDIVESMDAAVAAAAEVYVVKVPEQADVVVSVAPYPMDVDLYQSQKAVDNGKLVLKSGGVLIAVSKCRTGIGPDTFFQLMSSCSSLKEVMEKIAGEYKLGYHKAAKMVEIGLWAELWGVTDLDFDVLKRIFIRPFSSVQTAVDTALAQKGPDAQVLFLMDGSITVPQVTGGHC